VDRRSRSPDASSAILWISALDPAHDGQADRSPHRGLHKAVYASLSEHLGGWCNELDADLGSAPFGENLRAMDVREQDVPIVDEWR
jgi:MOSC domain-containing protein YiiM